MKTLFFLSFVVFLPVQADTIFISKSYYDGLGEKFRVERASSFDQCKESKRAQKIFVDRTNELREIAFWDEKGVMEEGGATNKPLLRLKVEEVFAIATSSENPCGKEEARPATSGVGASAQ